MIKFCKFCKKNIKIKNGINFGLHKLNCLFNPDREARYKRISRKLRHKRYWFDLECKKCNTRYKLLLTKNKFKKGKYNHYCSSFCSHSRKHKESTKNLLRKNLKNKYPKITIICKLCRKKRTLPYQKRFQQFCSRSCAIGYNNMQRRITKKTRRRLSLTTKRSYANGRLFYGGKTKWLSVKTSNGTIKVCGQNEVRTCKILDYLKSQKKIRNWEYTPDRVKYIGLDKKYHWYLIDFKVYKTKKIFYYIETKSYPLSKKDKIKLLAVKNSGYKIVPWFKKDLEYYEKITRRYPNDEGSSP